MTFLDWIMVAFLAAVYLATAVRSAMAAARFGRSPIRWLLITICLSAIPAMIVFHRDARRRARDTQTATKPPAPPSGMMRCPNCRALIDPSELAGMPVKVCPRCRLRMDKVNLA